MEAKDLLTSSHFPPGFRFHPTDEELISCYLSKKVTSSLPPGWDIVADIDIYKFNPWDLPGKAFFGDGEWFFFSPRERKYPNGFRPNRSAGCGYWKATGTDKPILGAAGTQCIGVKKALVFYEGRPPKGIKTDWVMHEYRILDSSATATAAAAALSSPKQKGSMRLDDYVLCRVRKKGNLSAVSSDVADTCSPAPSASVSNQSEENFASDCFTGWDEDNQLLRSFFNSPEDVFNLNPGSGDYLELPLEMGSIKRKPSFGVFEELMQLQPWKRLQESYSTDDLFSQSDSPNSVNQDFPNFFI